MEKQGDQSMTRDEALKKLGLADNAGHDEIYRVVEEKLGKLAEMADKAPTEDLKAKYLASRHQLERMRAMLLADADNRVTTPEAEPQPGTQRPSTGARSPCPEPSWRICPRRTLAIRVWVTMAGWS